MIGAVDDDWDLRSMREQDELEEDVRLVDDYGHSHPQSYGGVEYDEKDPVPSARVVAAFTRDLDVHLAALRALVPHPTRLDVRSCPLTAAEADALGDRIGELLLEVVPEITNLAVLRSVWTGVLVLVAEADVAWVRELIGNEPWVRVGAGGYRPLGRGSAQG